MDCTIGRGDVAEDRRFLDCCIGADGVTYAHYSDGSMEPFPRAAPLNRDSLQRAIDTIQKYANPPSTLPAIRARKLLRRMLGDWGWMRYRASGRICVRAKSGEVAVLRRWERRLKMEGRGVCQSNTAPGAEWEDWAATMLCYLRAEGGVARLTEGREGLAMDARDMEADADISRARQAFNETLRATHLAEMRRDEEGTDRLWARTLLILFAWACLALGYAYLGIIVTGPS